MEGRVSVRAVGLREGKVEVRVSHISQKTRDMGHPLVRGVERVKKSQARRMTVLLIAAEGPAVALYPLTPSDPISSFLSTVYC
jgi:hypothetical protein